MIEHKKEGYLIRDNGTGSRGGLREVQECSKDCPACAVEAELKKVKAELEMSCEHTKDGGLPLYKRSCKLCFEAVFVKRGI